MRWNVVSLAENTYNPSQLYRNAHKTTRTISPTQKPSPRELFVTVHRLKGSVLDRFLVTFRSGRLVF